MDRATAQFSEAQLMPRRWTPSEDVAVRLADALDYEHGGRRLVELADRLGRTEAAVRQRASRLRLERLQDEEPCAKP